VHFDKRKAKRADKRRRDKEIERCKREHGNRGEKNTRKRPRFDEFDREAA